MSDDIQEKLQSQIDNNKVILYMKGSKESPMCGFSAQVVNILNSYEVPYETVDVLLDPEVRQGIKDFSDWPTIPQLYVNGQFIGGCDICTEMHFNGELQPLVKDATSS
ncbi:MAG: Grx4 family monothiol glutaredoxin [Candidatus Dadabacteria bacterium]|nr:Grx4 family monothiol glutaredoxin [Candidatus Dadabacteria bacterium]NIQ15475.1 Grx4 family monothiol glutaredoxin [Candidatus Dadabacteria bacterium]